MLPNSVFRVALPDDDYMRQLGRTQYVLQSAEGLIFEIIQRLDPAVDLEMLADQTMHGLAEQLTSKVRRVAGDYSSEQMEQLTSAAARWKTLPPTRNNVIHSRPATHPSGAQRLYRWAPRRKAFMFIEPERLDDLAMEAESIVLELDDCRSWLQPLL